MRVLVVEDEVILAMMITDMLTELGHTVECADCVSDALVLVANADAALLDLKLVDELSYPVAKCLQDRAVPYAFLCGDRTSLLAEYRDRPVLDKPFAFSNLEEMITDLEKSFCKAE